MFEIKELITNALEKGLPEKSLFNCHALGVDSVVVSEENNQLVRIFFAWQAEHQLDNLHTDNGQFTVGVHNHKYNISLIPLVGSFINYEVFLGDEETRHGQLYEFEFQSGIGSEMQLKYRNMRNIQSINLRELSPGDQRIMLAPELHTVIVPKDGSHLTAWMVIEGMEVNSSLFYSPIEEPSIDATDMYIPMKRAEAEEALVYLLDRI